MIKEVETDTAARLKSSEERYQYLFNNSPACIIIWGLDDFSILEVNDSSILQYNYSKEDFLKLKITDLQIPEEAPEIKELVQKARADLSFIDSAIRKHINSAGDLMFMDINSHRIEYNGKPAILSIANNVTEKILLEKKLEEAYLKKQQEITEAVITAQEKERLEIGGELHDNVNQVLASSKLYLGLAKRDIGQYNPFLEETEILISLAISEIRFLSHSLIPPALDESELGEALNNLIATLAKTTTINIVADLKRFNEHGASDKLKLSIYRIVQEQFNNVLKHSKATTVHLSIAHEKGKILLHIKDNGIGFDQSTKTKGVGLLNIKSRASIFNGEVKVISSAGNGCELLVSFNCPPGN